MNDFFRPIVAIFYKDFLLELRTKETLNSMLIFAVLVMVTFSFAFEQDRALLIKTAPGILWTAIIFSGILGMNRSFSQEKEFGALDGVLLSPADRGAVFLGKTMANVLFLFILEAMLFLVFELFYNVNVFARFHFIALITVLATIGFAGLGTIFSAVAMNTKMREVMLPILLLPLSVPIFIAAVESTTAILAGQPLSAIMDWIQILLAFLVVSLSASFLLFEFVLIE